MTFRASVLPIRIVYEFKKSVKLECVALALSSHNRKKRKDRQTFPPSLGSVELKTSIYVEHSTLII